MKTISIAAIIALLYLANSPEFHEAGVTQRKILDLALSHIARMSTFLDEGEAAGDGSDRHEPAAGLRHGTLAGAGLEPGGLQPGNGFQFGARGLTPSDEWNRTFRRRE